MTFDEAVAGLDRGDVRGVSDGDGLGGGHGQLRAARVHLDGDRNRGGDGQRSRDGAADRHARAERCDADGGG